MTLALVLVPRLWRSTTGVRVEISMSSLRQGVSQASGSTPLALGAGISTIKTQREKTELVRQKTQLVREKTEVVLQAVSFLLQVLFF